MESRRFIIFACARKNTCYHHHDLLKSLAGSMGQRDVVSCFSLYIVLALAGLGLNSRLML